MTRDAVTSVAGPRPIRRLRWYIGGLLFLSTVINYIDRQTLSVLAPYLKTEYQWSNTDFAWVLIAFRIAYTVGQTIAGRVVDRLGTRRGLSLAVLWYSIAAMATSMAVGFRSLAGFWVPFLAADLGNFFGGGASSILIARGWNVGAARKVIAVFGGLGMMMLIPAVWTDSFVTIVACFAVATFAYAAFSTVILNLPADIYPTGSVASVSGLGGTGAGIGTITAIYVTGWVSDRYSFAPILIGASVLPLVAMAAMLLLIRNTKETREGMLNRI